MTGENAQRIFHMSADDAEREGIQLLAGSLPPIRDAELCILVATQAAAYFALAKLKRDKERSHTEDA